MKFSKFLVQSVLASVALAQTVYLIRHGEKPADGSDGLSALGLERAQCLRDVFAANSTYDIGYILAETPKASMTLPFIPSRFSFTTRRTRD